MPNSLRVKLSKLKYKGNITDVEYQELIKKLDGHDAEVRADAIDEFENLLYQFGHYESFSLKFEIYQEDLKRLIQQLKEQNNAE